MWFYEILGVWTLYYLGIGVIFMLMIFSQRKDMWSMVKNVLGLYGWLRYVMWPLVMITLLIVWPIVLILAIRRRLLQKTNIVEKNEYQGEDGGQTVSKEQVADLEMQIARSGAGVVRGKLKETLKKKAYKFIRDKKKQGQGEVTVDEVLVNIDRSPEFLKLCERIGYPRADMVEMCIGLGAIEIK